MIGLLLGFLGFLLSPMGMFAWGLGLVAFLGMPVIPAISGRFKRFANVHLWFALWSLQRAAIVVTEHGELLFKSMQFNDLGVERISFGGDTKDFEDPATALHHWMGFPFALADEVHGVLFDPRLAAIGGEKADYDKKGIGPVRASETDYNAYGIDQWIPGVFELSGDYSLVNLSNIRNIIDGGERAEYPTRVEELYKLVRLPHTSRTGALRILIPVAAFIGTIVAFWQISKSSGGGGGADTVISGGGLALLFTAMTSEDIKQRLREFVDATDWWTVGAWVALVGPVVLVELAVLLLAGPVMFIIANLTFLMGFTFLPFVTMLGRASSTISGGLAKYVYLRLGLVGYDRPVLEWQPRGYQLQEARDLGVDDAEVNWFGLANNLIGFTYQPSEDTFGPDVMDTHDIKNVAELATDGGEPDTSLPAGWVRAPKLKRDVYGAYVPRRSNLDDDNIYLDSHIALGRMTDAAVGEKSLRRLLWAKEEYGDGSFGLSDKALLWATMGSLILGSAIGVFLFFL